MRVIGFDPSIVTTGWAIVDAPDNLVSAGTIRPQGESIGERAVQLAREAIELVKTYGIDGDIIAIETPFEKRRPPGVIRSVRTLPNYGVAVGALFGAFAASHATIGVASDVWSEGIAKVNTYKTGRVAAAAYLFRIDASKFGAPSVAQNVADAALLARWVLCRDRYTRRG